MTQYQTQLAQVVLGGESCPAIAPTKVPFQVHSVKIGKQFASLCSEMLLGQGWKLTGPVTIPELGVKVNQVGYTKNGTKTFFQFTGSFNGDNPGLKRFNSFKQALASCYLVRQVTKTPTIVLTSHQPNPGTAGEVGISITKNNGLIRDVLSVFDRSDIKTLQDILNNE
jgi:hypothetical protein